MNASQAPPPNLVDLLVRIEPIPEPAPVSYLPQTEAWLWIAALLAATVGAVAWKAWLRWRSNAYRREALRAIRAAANAPDEIAVVVRRTALAAFPRARVAGLYGDAWLAFLDETLAKPDSKAFREGAGRALASAPYTARPEPDPALAELAARWVRDHRSPEPAVIELMAP